MKNVYNFKTVSSALIAGSFLAVYVAILAGTLTWIVATTLHLGTFGFVIIGGVFAVPALMGIAVAYRWAFAAETNPENH